ncbi:MAG: methylmalonyl-CoA mutase subunit beta [Alphaproteobacteria bacterium]
MSEEKLAFAGEFPAASYDEWRGAVDKALKGAPFEKRLVTKLYEGITIQPVYTRTDWPSEGDPSGFPGVMPFTRGGSATGADGWDIGQEHAHPDLKTSNAAILVDLERGATSVVIRFDQAARAGLDADAAAAESLAGQDGVMVYSVACFDKLMDKVLVDLVPVSLEAGAQFLPAAALLSGLWKTRGVAADKAQGAFNADPLGALAATGALPVSVDAALAQMSDLAAYTAKAWPKVTAVAVNTAPYHDAGATEAQDLACSMATGVAYLRAMTAAGMSIDAACRQIVFHYPVGCDFFLTMAKLRAARKMWSRIAESCGASELARVMTIRARSADRMMSRRDPWVNMLRTTVAAFAGGVAGANSVTVLPFDAALGLPDAFSRRIARNSQVVLKEESNLGRVIDPAGGSWYIESLTDQLASVAWGLFQEIEKAGGMAKALADGSVAKQVAASQAEREKNIGKRRDPLTGINEFPNIAEKPVVTDKPNLGALRSAAATGLAGVRKADAAAAVAKAGKGGVAAAAVEAAVAGATLGTLAAALKGEGARCSALPKHRFAETFESLRDAADAYKAKTGNWPRIFLANVGSVAQHTARATFAKNFFEAGGIETLGNNGFADPGSCAKAFKDSGAAVAIICSSDAVYEEQVAKVAPALKAAGAKFLFLAGNPGEKKQAYGDAGVDDFIFLGCDVLGTLRATLARLGVTN